MVHLRSSMVTAGAVTALVLVLGMAGGSVASTSPARAAGHSPFVGVIGPVVVAVGDIACAPGSSVTRTRCVDAATAKVASRSNPRYVFALGDLQYHSGRLTEFRNAYAHTWGRSKAITRPVPGNHEYRTRGAAGYYAYFRGRTRSPGYYAFNVNSRRWRVYALNSNCSQIDCVKEAAWLDRDMTRHPRRCSAILMHHPLYSSGTHHGDSPEARRFWRVALKHHADLALAGHEHNYERFQRMDADGHRTTSGMRSFVVGTGGEELYGRGNVEKGSEFFYHRSFGVLVLKLGLHRFAWKFRTTGGDVIDRGRVTCRR